MATILFASGQKEEVEPENGKDFSLAELQKIVGGDIEIVNLGEGDGIMVINEEGKLLGLPENADATALYGAVEDYIAGDALVCESSQVE